MKSIGLRLGLGLDGLVLGLRLKARTGEHVLWVRGLTSVRCSSSSAASSATRSRSCAAAEASVSSSSLCAVNSSSSLRASETSNCACSVCVKTEGSGWGGRVLGKGQG